jgi:uncharacterized membrane protein YgcG
MQLPPQAGVTLFEGRNNNPMGGRKRLAKSDLRFTLVSGWKRDLDKTRQIGGIESMKKCPSVFRMAVAAITATAVGAFCTVASAQNSPSTNAPATAPVAASVPQAAAPAPAAVPALPYGVGEVLKMYQGGINKEVIVNYINSTALPYHLTADGIIYLQTLGVPQEITKAMILRDGQLQQQQQMAMQQMYQQQAMQASAQGQPPPQYGAAPAPGQTPPPDVAAPSTPPPSVTVIGSDPPVYYDYGYPYYGYAWPYYYGGPYFGGGWGWGGRGWGGYRGGGGFHGGGGFGGGHGGGGHR